MTHKQWFNNVLHLHPVHEEGALIWRYISAILVSSFLHNPHGFFWVVLGITFPSCNCL